MGFTDDLIQSMNERYSTVFAGVTSAEEIAAGLLSTSLQTAEVTGVHAHLFTIPILSTIGREITLQGESIWQYSGDDGLVWLQQAPSEMAYATNPSIVQHQNVLRFARNINWQTGRGMSALQCAPQLKATLKGIETQLQQEGGISAMYVTPVPQSASAREGGQSALQKLWTTFKNLKIKQSLVEGELQTGITNYQPTGNYQQRRLGIDTPQNVINLFEKIQHVTLTALGVPGPVVYPADANSQRESWRIYLSTIVDSCARIISAEARRVGLDVSLSFPELKSSDIAARARAFVSLVKDGAMTMEQAAAVSGILSELPEAR